MGTAHIPDTLYEQIKKSFQNEGGRKPFPVKKAKALCKIHIYNNYKVYVLTQQLGVLTILTVLAPYFL